MGKGTGRQGVQELKTPQIRPAGTKAEAHSYSLVRNSACRDEVPRARGEMQSAAPDRKKHPLRTGGTDRSRKAGPSVRESRFRTGESFFAPFSSAKIPCHHPSLMLRCVPELISMFTQATIKDVARAAGVHFTTVSMALRGHPAIAARTRIRIEGVAHLLGYQRNEIFSALSRQRKKRPNAHPIPTLLYLGRARSDRHFYGMDHHRQLVAGAAREAKALGYQLMINVVGPSGILPEKLQGYLAQSNAAGILIGAWDPAMEVPAVDWTLAPTIRIDSRHVPAQVPLVSFDQMKCVIVSFRKLHSLGYRRIGLALGEKDEDATDGLHFSGWLVAQTEFPRLTKIPPLLFPPKATFNEVLPLLQAWMRQHRVDVVMCNWKSIILMMRTLRAKMGRHIGCVCLCRGTQQRHLAGIAPNLDLVGQRAVSLLGSIIHTPPEKNSTPPMNSYVEGTWHDGLTIKAQS